MNTRTEALIGKFAMDLLKERKVFVFGVGGVGGYVAEALARSGVGTVAVADFDTVEETNLNRQIIALKSTVGQNKAELMAARMRQINDKIVAKYFPEKIDETNIRYMMIEKYDYIIDAVDDVKAKVAIIKMAKEKKIPVISCMGTGNKIRPEKLKIADIKKTTTCPLAKAVRKALRVEGITEGVKVVYSTEEPLVSGTEDENGKVSPASAIFVPAAAGIMIAGEVFRDLTYLNE
ncbi:MAG: tRNA threonylcarbamoyladenosine dehydratase [Firmicutes bacterium]|nr:tRNA threonylcarbamoyladenosine dehydratase [Bacillota bacterium]